MSNLVKLIIRTDHAFKDLKKFSSNQNLKGFCLLKNWKQHNVTNQIANYSTRLNTRNLTNQHKLLKVKTINCYEFKPIKTTRVNQALPPVIWLVIRPVLNVAAALGYIDF